MKPFSDRSKIIQQDSIDLSAKGSFKKLCIGTYLVHRIIDAVEDISLQALLSLWCCIKLDHCIKYGQPLSGNIANPFVVNCKYLFRSVKIRYHAIGNKTKV